MRERVHIDVGHDLPDAGDGLCCIGNAAMGPERCTCWRPEYDLVQAEVQEGPAAVREQMCGDCAFRCGSPERSGDERYENSHEGALDDLVLEGGVFFCHQGMRRRVALVHPAGVRAPAQIDAYEPPTRDGSFAFKADGSPAEVCAGFAARARKVTRG